MKQKIFAFIFALLFFAGAFCWADEDMEPVKISINASVAIDPNLGSDWTFQVIAGSNLIKVKKEGTKLIINALAKGTAKVRFTSATKDKLEQKIEITTGAGSLQLKLKRLLEDYPVEIDLYGDMVKISGAIKNYGDWVKKEAVLEQLKNDISRFQSQGGTFIDESWIDLFDSLKAALKKFPQVTVSRKKAGKTYPITLTGRVTPDERDGLNKILRGTEFRNSEIIIQDDVETDIIPDLQKELTDKGLENYKITRRRGNRIEVTGTFSSREKFGAAKKILADSDYQKFGVVDCIVFDVKTYLKNEITDRGISEVDVKDKKDKKRIEVTGTLTDIEKFNALKAILKDALRCPECKGVDIRDLTVFDISRMLEQDLKEFAGVKMEKDKSGICQVTGVIKDAKEWKKFSEVMKAKFPGVANNVTYQIDIGDIKNLKMALEAERFTVIILDKATDKNNIYPVNVIALYSDHKELFVGSRMLCQQDIDKVEIVLKESVFYQNANVKKEKKLTLDENETLVVEVYLIKETDSNNFSRNTKVNIGLTMNADFFRTLMDGNSRGKTATFGANFAGNLEVLKTVGMISDYTSAKKTINANAKDFQQFSDEQDITLTVPGSDAGSVKVTAGTVFSVRAKLLKEKSNKSAQDILCAEVEFDSCRFTSADSSTGMIVSGGPDTGALKPRTYYFNQPVVLMTKNNKQKIVQEEGTPFMKDLPLIGMLFSNKVKTEQNVTFTLVTVITRESRNGNSTAPANVPGKNSPLPPDYGF